ncbi:MAG TPA: 3-isopropylmalate dehydratase [Alphaproteobacteria bacterium]|nr:3-isopropylmalate dehydratase [Alphaproteobacteria bacterium]
MSELTSAAGRAWVFGDAVDTDVLAPGHLMKLPAEELATHCLEAIRPEFSRAVRPGDVVVAGRSFGIGSSREQAAVSLKLLGVGAVLALSYARIFWRNALNLGLPALVIPDATRIAEGDQVTVDVAAGRVDNRTTGESWQIPPLPPHLLRIVEVGGLMPYLKSRYGRAAASAAALTGRQSG